MCFFFQAEDGIRDVAVTGVQTCALPILDSLLPSRWHRPDTATGRAASRRSSQRRTRPPSSPQRPKCHVAEGCDCNQPQGHASKRTSNKAIALEEAGNREHANKERKHFGQ